MIMKNIFKIVLQVIVIVLVIDFAGFVWWTTSGKKPVDSFYVGAISANIINKVIK